MPTMSRDDAQRALKRRKTSRACDHCRQQRIRCEYNPSEDACKHCTEYGIPCLKVAPAPRTSRAGYHTEEPDQGLEPGYRGATTLAELFSTVSQGKPSAETALATLDAKYDHYRDSFTSTERTGVLVGRLETASYDGRFLGCSFKHAQQKLADEVGASTVLNQLLDTCRRRIIPVFPVVSITESVGFEEIPADLRSSLDKLDLSLNPNSTSPSPLPPIVRLIHQAQAALSREVPAAIRKSVLKALHQALEGADMNRLQRNASATSVQTLLLLSSSPELHSYDAAETNSQLWRRSGIAIRMAYELALHRDVSPKVVSRFQIHRRRRLWGACVTVDRWLAVMLGQSIFIDLEQCDALPPLIYPDHDITSGPNRLAPFRFLHELYKLSILLGRIYCLSWTPRAFERATDQQFLAAQNELDVWRGQLPDVWPYTRGMDIAAANSLLNLFFVLCQLMLWLPFRRPFRSIPDHLQYRPAPERWADLIERAERAISWAETAEGEFYLDTWRWVAWSLIVISIVLLLQYEETRDEYSIDWLRRAVKVVQRWAEGAVGQTYEAKSARAKLADYMDVLLAAAIDLPRLEEPKESQDGKSDGINFDRLLAQMPLWGYTAGA